MIGSFIKKCVKEAGKCIKNYAIKEGKERLVKSILDSFVVRGMCFVRDKILIRYIKKIIDECIENGLNPMDYIGEYLEGPVEIEILPKKYREIIKNSYY